MYYLLLVLFNIQISEAKFYLAEIGSADEGPGEQATRGGGVRISFRRHNAAVRHLRNKLEIIHSHPAIVSVPSDGCQHDLDKVCCVKYYCT